MITYYALLDELKALSEEKFAAFQSKLFNDDKLTVLGVRTPALRKRAKKYKAEYSSLSAFPNEYYEVVFLKLSVAAFMPYEQFITVCDGCVRLLTDWALCDCFSPACIKTHREEFVPYIKRYLAAGEGYFNDGEFARRFALTALLSFYVEEEYLSFIFDSITNCRPDKYYVMMGAAWLLAEVLIKHYEAGLGYLRSTMCDITVKNKAISKACDSFRVSDERKAELKTLRSKK